MDSTLTTSIAALMAEASVYKALAVSLNKDLTKQKWKTAFMGVLLIVVLGLWGKESARDILDSVEDSVDTD